MTLDRMNIPGVWTFEDEGVAKSFNSHVRGQLPWYDMVVASLKLIAAHYLPDQGGVMYDIGASTGNLYLAMKDVLQERGVRYWAVEKSQHMAEKWQGDPRDLLVEDAMDHTYRPFDVAVLNLTMMFLPTSRRAEWFRQLRGQCRAGGAVLVVDRVAEASSEREPLGAGKPTGARIFLRVREAPGPVAELVGNLARVGVVHGELIEGAVSKLGLFLADQYHRPGIEADGHGGMNPPQAVDDSGIGADHRLHHPINPVQLPRHSAVARALGLAAQLPQVADGGLDRRHAAEEVLACRVQVVPLGLDGIGRPLALCEVVGGAVEEVVEAADEFGVGIAALGEVNVDDRHFLQPQGAGTR